MAKSKNHTAHNQVNKASQAEMDPKFLRNQRYAKKKNPVQGADQQCFMDYSATGMAAEQAAFDQTHDISRIIYLDSAIINQDIIHLLVCILTGSVIVIAQEGIAQTVASLLVLDDVA
ncbi:MAG: 60S ribosomal L29-1-like [Trebouxia sp. A1-2]|nr:MAG: 60S ribosomal L29-1-like [Trebouxia sp. A1-2]